MKKFVYLLAVVSILIFPVYAEEQNDISGMTTEELVSLIEDTQLELERRGYGEQYVGPIYSGKYIVGEDIPSGSYDISSVAESYSDFYASQYQVSVYDSEEEYANDSPITEWRMPGGQGYHVMLKDGNVLEITASNVDMHLFKSNTIF